MAWLEVHVLTVKEFFFPQDILALLIVLFAQKYRLKAPFWTLSPHLLFIETMFTNLWLLTVASSFMPLPYLGIRILSLFGRNLTKWWLFYGVQLPFVCAYISTMPAVQDTHKYVHVLRSETFSNFSYWNQFGEFQCLASRQKQAMLNFFAMLITYRRRAFAAWKLEQRVAENKYLINNLLFTSDSQNGRLQTKPKYEKQSCHWAVRARKHCKGDCNYITRREIVRK